jgi:phospholipase C
VGKKVDRRSVLKGISAAAGVAALGCGSSSKAGAPDGAAGGFVDAGAVDAARTPDAQRAIVCPGSDLSFEETFTGIDTVVVLCMENRSFDHYLGSLQLSEGWDIDGLDGTESNPRAGGGEAQVYRLDDFTPDDPPHSWDECHNQWNGGANDGFVSEHAGASEHQVMGYHERDQLDTVYGLADDAAVCDRYFSSVMGPTWPNRYFLHCASSKGIKSNLPALNIASIWDRLGSAGVSNTNYFHDVAWATGALGKLSGLSLIEKFFQDAAAGSLPSFCLIDPDFVGAGANDDHPAHDVRLGQALIGSIYAALTQSPQWDRCLFVLTYDEHGGFYDHVPPPTTFDPRSDFQQLGFRVPAMVAGPTVKRGCPVSTVYDHVSIAATTTRLFGLDPINERVTQTSDFRDCINPDYIGNPQAGAELPPVEISLSALRGLKQTPRHLELAQALASKSLPSRLNRKSESLAIAERVMRYGESLGAVTLTR